MKTIPGIVEHGKVAFNRRSYVLFCEKNDGKKVDLVLREKERTLSQLGMYRAWLSQVAAETGNDTEELHEFLLSQLAPRTVMTIRGPKGEVEYERHKRTSGGHTLSMNKEEMSEFMEKASVLTGHPLPTKQELEAMGYLVEWG